MVSHNQTGSPWCRSELTPKHYAMFFLSSFLDMNFESESKTHYMTGPLVRKKQVEVVLRAILATEVVPDS